MVQPGHEDELSEALWYYRLFKAAERCNTTPWDLARQPIVWREMALIVAEAEAHAQEVNAKT